LNKLKAQTPNSEIHSLKLELSIFELITDSWGKGHSLFILALEHLNYSETT